MHPPGLQSPSLLPSFTAGDVQDDTSFIFSIELSSAGLCAGAYLEAIIGGGV